LLCSGFVAEIRSFSVREMLAAISFALWCCRTDIFLSSILAHSVARICCWSLVSVNHDVSHPLENKQSPE